MRFVVFIKDPYIKTSYVGVAPVQVQADEVTATRSAALDEYNATELDGLETAEESEGLPEPGENGRREGSMRITPVEPQAPYDLIHKSS